MLPDADAGAGDEVLGLLPCCTAVLPAHRDCGQLQYRRRLMACTDASLLVVGAHMHAYVNGCGWHARIAWHAALSGCAYQMSTYRKNSTM